MVTKLKNSRKAKIIKIISAIVAFITGWVTLFSAALFIGGWADYESSDFSILDLASKTNARNAGSVYFDTGIGKSRLFSVAYCLNDMTTKYRNDDYFYNVYLPERSAQIEQEYQSERESYIDEMMAEYPDRDTGDLTAEEYWGHAFQDTRGTLETRIRGVTNSYNDCKLNLEIFSIYAVDPNSGYVYTNVADDSPIDTIVQMPYVVRYTSETSSLEKKVDINNYTEEPATEVEVTDLAGETVSYENFGGTASYSPEQDFIPYEGLYDYGTFEDLSIDFYIGFDYDSLRSSADWNQVLRSNPVLQNISEFKYLIDTTSAVAPFAVVCAVLFVASLILTLCYAGRGPLPEEGTEHYRRKVLRFGGTITGREPVLHNALDVIPNDLHLILGLGLTVCSGIGIIESYSSMRITNWVGPIITLILSGMAAMLFFLELCTSISRNAKAGTYWPRTVAAAIGRGFKRLGRRLRYHFSPMGYQFKGLRKYVRRWLITYFVVMIPLSLIPVLPVFVNIFVVLFLWRSIASLDKLMQYAREVQSGNLNVTLDTSKFPKWLLPFTEDIIHLRDGMQAAVEEALKSERLKTELITNVSHDLKTPLTSIINYTGLLSKCDIQDPQAQDYIAVLQNKSDRLKHLIEDLVEASKASTGNIQFNPVKLNLYEMAVQAVGENEDALTNQGVTVVINEPETQPAVWADSQKTWRIVENLLSNVRKYSMPGTRAYINVRTEGSFGVLTVKNISRDELNISPEDLMERFVRGDESRSTEGSGLGLSIAQNLCEKQGGKFEIEIDGDLFKATVRLPLAPENAVPPVPHPDYIQVDPTAGQM